MKVLIGNFKGPKGDTGGKGDKGNKGDRGEPGQRGSRWESGTGVTGTNTIGTKFPNSGITDAQTYDYYVNINTGNLYECTVAGASDTAEWVYIGNFRGPKGDTGPAGSISDINNQRPTYSETSVLANIESGETVAVAFGKLRKAVSVLLSHYAQKATQSILGHVKLSNSAAITIPGEYALDAVEKNASVEGTLANLIQQTNSNLTGQNFFEASFKRDYDYTNCEGWRGILNWYDKNARTGYLSEYAKNGSIELYLSNERGDILINGNSIAYIVNTINNLKNSKTWNISLSTQTDGTHEIPDLNGTEALLTYGYVYRIETTMTIPMDVFASAKGEGNKILFDTLTIEILDTTHIKVEGIDTGYLFRIFTR